MNDFPEFSSLMAVMALIPSLHRLISWSLEYFTDLNPCPYISVFLIGRP